MIRGRTLRPDAACHSADVLTPTERSAERLPKGFTPPQRLTFRERDCKWGDVPAIRKALLKLMGEN